MSDISIKSIYSYIQNNSITLNEEENTYLNSVFTSVDTEDEQGNNVNQGDGKLNNNEWTLFKNKLKNSYGNIYNKLTSYIQSTNENTQYNYFTSHQQLDTDMYKEEALRKQFPEDKYTIETGDDSVTVTDKSTNEEILRFSNSGDSYNLTVRANKDEESWIFYDQKGRITSETPYKRNPETNCFSQDGCIIEYDYSNNIKTVGRNLYNLQTGKTLVEYKDDCVIQYGDDGSYAKTDENTGVRTYYDNKGNETKSDLNLEYFAKAIKRCKSKEELDSLLNEKLNGDDVLNILGDTQCQNLIFNKYALYCNGNPKDIKNQYYQKALEQAEQKGIYIEDLKESDNIAYDLSKLAKRYYSENNKLPDETITKDTKIEQGTTGDCWLLEKISGIAQSDGGAEILNNMCVTNKNPDGTIKSVTVTIQNEEYEIPIDEINGATEFSNGNLYVRAIEIGTYKYMQKRGVEHTFGIQNQTFLFNGMGGGNSSLGSEILLGDGVDVIKKGSINVVFDKTRKVNDNFMKELLSTDNVIAGVSTSKGGFQAAIVETGENTGIIPNHAYSIVKKDSNYIYLVEPSNNKKILKMSFEEFQNCFEVGDITPINNVTFDDDLPKIQHFRNDILEEGSIEITPTSSTQIQKLTSTEEREKYIQKNCNKIRSEVSKRLGVNFYDVNVTFDGRFYKYAVYNKK